MTRPAEEPHAPASARAREAVRASEASPALEVTFLGSGSSGNSTVIASGRDAVIVDCGFSAKETLRRAGDAGVDVTCVRALLVTHEHTDHVSGVRVLAKRLGVPVYATAGTRRAAALDHHVAEVRTLAPGEPFAVGALEIIAFRTSHDAAEPVGYRVSKPHGPAIGLATDTGEMTAEAFEALAECELLALEFNHDEDMLANGPYPWFLKQRIASARGHLSNAAAVRALERLGSDRLTAVFGMHVSRTNNTHETVAAELSRALARLDLAVDSAPVRQDAPTTRFRVG